MNFRVGQKVVCIKREAWVEWPANKITPCERAPSYGAVCRIKAIQREGGLIWLVLADYPDSWNSKFFRPAVDKPAGISVFTKILDEVNGRIGENA